jgi:hypothetical protein
MAYDQVLPQIRSVIPLDIDANLRKAIVDRLAYANECSLRTRLKRLIKALEPATSELFCCDPQQFVSGVVETRNYLTHYSSSTRRVLQSLDLHWATLKLRTMFSIVLLKHLGLAETLIRDRVRADYTLSREREEWTNADESGTAIDDKARLD